MLVDSVLTHSLLSLIAACEPANTQTTTLQNCLVLSTPPMATLTNSLLSLPLSDSSFIFHNPLTNGRIDYLQQVISRYLQRKTLSTYKKVSKDSFLRLLNDVYKEHVHLDEESSDDMYNEHRYLDKELARLEIHDLACESSPDSDASTDQASTRCTGKLLATTRKQFNTNTKIILTACVSTIYQEGNVIKHSEKIKFNDKIRNIILGF